MLSVGMPPVPAANTQSAIEGDESCHNKTRGRDESLHSDSRGLPAGGAGTADWIPPNSGTTDFFNAIQFPVDELTGYAVGRNGTIVNTFDGGGGVEETPSAEVRTANVTAIVRGVLRLEGDCPRTGTVLEAVLLHAAGREVLDLHPGANDVRHLGPGVYFVRPHTVDGGRKTAFVTKVIVTR